MSFSEGSICFKAPRDWDSIPVSPLRKAAVLLAVALGARVVGEEGEEYKWTKLAEQDAAPNLWHAVLVQIYDNYNH